ncbi:hypothetical protein NP233_g4498 [Leucocoprinus birnbaumii]|uniref:Protein kinase domain-containing protein n=1 Tax=Leucocoprinus birnbaumii TaxID=56174 RepID=A0AAD5VUI7_9AGAR|nr:hypothetical protein NP233_g4498 [Leucocoprinus birnbaumii]
MLWVSHLPDDTHLLCVPMSEGNGIHAPRPRRAWDSSELGEPRASAPTPNRAMRGTSINEETNEETKTGNSDSEGETHNENVEMSPATKNSALSSPMIEGERLEITNDSASSSRPMTPDLKAASWEDFSELYALLSQDDIHTDGEFDCNNEDDDEYFSGTESEEQLLFPLLNDEELVSMSVSTILIHPERVESSTPSEVVTLEEVLPAIRDAPTTVHIRIVDTTEESMQMTRAPLDSSSSDFRNGFPQSSANSVNTIVPEPQLLVPPPPGYKEHPEVRDIDIRLPTLSESRSSGSESSAPTSPIYTPTDEHKRYIRRYGSTQSLFTQTRFPVASVASSTIVSDTVSDLKHRASLPSMQMSSASKPLEYLDSNSREEEQCPRGTSAGEDSHPATTGKSVHSNSAQDTRFIKRLRTQSDSPRPVGRLGIPPWIPPSRVTRAISTPANPTPHTPEPWPTLNLTSPPRSHSQTIGSDINDNLDSLTAGPITAPFPLDSIMDQPLDPLQYAYRSEVFEKINKYVEAFFRGGDLDSAKFYFSDIPTAYHSDLVDGLVSKVLIVGEDDSLRMVKDLFSAVSSSSLCSKEDLVRGFDHCAKRIVAITADGTKASCLFTAMLLSTGLYREQCTELTSNTENTEKILDLWTEQTVLRHDLRCLIVELCSIRACRDLIAGLKQDDAQDMAEFLNEILLDNEFLDQAKRKPVWKVLVQLCMAAQVFPKRYEIKQIECDFARPENEGGFGIIYRGTHQGRHVCIKAVRIARLSDNKQRLKAHARELVLAAHLDHPNILPFHGVYMSEGSDPMQRFCIVTPWMDNGDLTSFLRHFAPDTSQRNLLVSDIASGIHYLHSRNIVHADLKAGNILVSGAKRAMIADFGISHLVMTKFVTSSENAGGTVNWMAPELLTDQTSPAKETDVWAFSCVCWETFTGDIPFSQHKTLGHLLRAFMERPLALPACPTGLATKTNPVGDLIWGLMKWCWDTEPNQRPTTAEIQECIEAMRLQDDRPLSGYNVTSTDTRH